MSFGGFQVFVSAATVTNQQECMNTGSEHCHGNWGGCELLGLDGGVNGECERESEEVCLCVIGGCVSVVLHNYSEPRLTNIPLRYPALFAWRSAKTPKELASTPTNQHFHSSFSPPRVHLHDLLHTWGGISVLFCQIFFIHLCPTTETVLTCKKVRF